jgi:hypothetical protein
MKHDYRASQSWRRTWLLAIVGVIVYIVMAIIDAGMAR